MPSGQANVTSHFQPYSHCLTRMLRTQIGQGHLVKPPRRHLLQNPPPTTPQGPAWKQPSSTARVTPALCPMQPLPPPTPVRHQLERQQDHARGPTPHLGVDLCLPWCPAGKGHSGFSERLCEVGGGLLAARGVSSAPGYCRDLGHRRSRVPSCLPHVVSFQGWRCLRL